MSVDYRVGDTRDVVKTIADGSVDFICSSPPFLALRSYVPADHASKGDEIGSERNPAEFIDMLLGLTAEWGRVLAPHGSIAIELGDTYSGKGAEPASPDALNGYRVGRDLRPVGHDGPGWPVAKSLALIPQLYAVALAYGINPLTGQPSPAGRWLVRNVIVWHRPNPAVGALGDKVRPSTSYIVVATRSAKRWFDLTAVRTEGTEPGRIRQQGEKRSVLEPHRNGATLEQNPAGAPPLDAWFDHHDGSHDTWTLTTQPSRLAHYAMWPAKLAERLILSMCPREVCRVCGEPRRRIEKVYSHPNDVQAKLAAHIRERRESLGLSRQEVNTWFGYVAGVSNWERTDGASSAVLPRPQDWPTLRDRLGLSAEFDDVVMGDRSWTESTVEYTATTRAGLGQSDTLRSSQIMVRPSLKSATMRQPDLGWTDCGCNCPTCVGKRVVNIFTEPGEPEYGDRCPDCVHGRAFRPGLVLDPFAGSGTTLAVADLHGRDAIGIDFDARNKAIYPARYDEVKRALFGTPAPMPGQEAFDFEEITA